MIREIKISKKIIDENQPCFIIAEAGVNHNGKINLAKKMIDVAKAAGADAIKFQTFVTEELVSANAPKANYQKKSVPKLSQFEMLKLLELSKEDFSKLSSYCKQKNIIFFSSCFDAPSAKLLHQLNVPAFKFGSGELTNLPLLKQVAKYNRPIILSTGMATIYEISKAVNVIYSEGNKSLVLLHCTTNYPVETKEVNLKAIETLKKKYHLPIGFSDHTQGIAIALAARAMGACVIEKHFTLDKSMPGPDHRASLEKEELAELIKSIRLIEQAFGDGRKVPQKSEIEMRKIVRKSIVAANFIEKGQEIKEKMLVFRRPGTGVSPDFASNIIGKKAKKDIEEGELISLKDIN